MNKGDLISAVAQVSGFSKADATKAVDSIFFHVIMEELKKGGDIRLVGFGTFTVIERKETEGRNPRTGEKLVIPASRFPKFKPGKVLKDSVANAKVSRK